MSVLQTLAVFAGIPLGVCLLVAGLAYAAGGRHTPRYRPGRSFEFTPVWYLAAQAADQPADGAELASLVVARRRALPPGRASAPPVVVSSKPGGARGTW